MIRQTVILGAGGGTSFTILGLVVLLLGGILLLTLPKRGAIVALLIAVFLIPMSQRLVLAGVNLTTYRLLILLGLGRVLVRGEAGGIQWWSHPLDRVVFFYGVAKAVTFTLLWLSVAALVNRLGYFVDDVGGYLLFRCLIRDRADIDRMLKALAALCAVFAVFMAYEFVTDHNLFFLLGNDPVSLVRDGKVRAVASFGHAVLAGTFAATLFPIFFGYLVVRDTWSFPTAFAATAATCLMVLTSSSSGPALTLIAAVAGFMAWPMRRCTYIIKWTVIGTLVSLHMVMKDPVWSLLFRVRFIGGGSGYHRYQLIDQSVKHFSEWWLLGTKNNGLWGIDMWDLANHYVACCITGGLISFVLFITIIRRGFVSLSQLRAAAVAAGDRDGEWRAWTLTVALLAHAVAYFGISYFDQTQVLWAAFLSAIAALALEQPVASTAPVDKRHREPATGLPPFVYRPARPAIARTRSAF